MEHKNQHFVPKSYLNAWCDPDTPSGQTPYVWLFERDERVGRKKAPANIFSEPDFYTLLGEDGRRDLKVERFLGSLETNFVDLRRDKLNKRQALSTEELLYLCAFCAAMHTRTRAQRDHFRAHWRDSLETMDKLAEWAGRASEEQIRNFNGPLQVSEDLEATSLSREDVQRIVQYPTQTILPAAIRAQVPLLFKMNAAILCTADETGFITSDHPCTWYDPTYRNFPPRLTSRTIEVTLPLSPQQLLLFNRRGIVGYINVQLRTVAQANWALRSRCHGHYVVRRNRTESYWFADEMHTFNCENGT